MCHASWPMASTSWVWLLRAITVGSLSTMPRPLAYTSAVGCGDSDQHRGLADVEDADPVQDGDAPECRPAPPGLAGDVRQPGRDFFLVGLVLQGRDTGTALGVVAHGAGEQHDRAAVRA